MSKTKNDKARSDQIQAIARELVKDPIPPSYYRQLMKATGCTAATARRHVTRALIYQELQSKKTR